MYNVHGKISYFSGNMFPWPINILWLWWWYFVTIWLQTNKQYTVHLFDWGYFYHVKYNLKKGVSLPVYKWFSDWFQYRHIKIRRGAHRWQHNNFKNVQGRLPIKITHTLLKSMGLTVNPAKSVYNDWHINAQKLLPLIF